MNLHRVVIAASIAGALMLPFAAANAQQAPKTAESWGSASVPGVCMLSRGAVLAESKVGKAATARLQQLAKQAGAELQIQGKPLAQDIQQFRAKASTMTAAQRATQAKSLQERRQALEIKAKKLKARIGITRDKARARIGNVADPLVVNIYKQHGCGILLDRDNVVLGGNASNDITAAVIKALNAKMSTITFNLAPLPKKQAAAKPSTK